MWRHLVCARCNAVVAEGRCPSCRRVRDASGSPAGELLAAALGVLLVALVALLVLVGEPALGAG